MSLVLAVDDDYNICDLITMYLEKEGYKVITAHDGIKAVETFKAAAPDIVLLDIMLPGADGIEVCREIRRISRTPVIMLTAKGETFDKVLGLEIGADDYIVKPFEPRELVARIKAVLRRSQPKLDETEELVFPGLVINLTTYTLIINGKETEVPKKELELLYYLASNPNRVFSRDALLDKVWGFDFYGNSRTVDVHIHRLREKLDGVSDVWRLKTVSRVGYKFEI